MGKVNWSADNDRKLLIRLIDRSAKAYPTDELCTLFPGATPKAIEERIAKLKREAKALDKQGYTTTITSSSPSTPQKRNKKSASSSKSNKQAMFANDSDRQLSPGKKRSYLEKFIEDDEEELDAKDVIERTPRSAALKASKRFKMDSEDDDEDEDDEDEEGGAGRDAEHELLASLYDDQDNSSDYENIE